MQRERQKPPSRAVRAGEPGGVAACSHRLFEAQVESAPDAVALTFDGQRPSYREFDSLGHEAVKWRPGIDVLFPRDVGEPVWTALYAEGVYAGSTNRAFLDEIVTCVEEMGAPACAH